MTTADVATRRAHVDDHAPTTEQVAGVLGGIPAIGIACEALRTAGWRASIAGNRITVNDAVRAQLIGTAADDAAWVISMITGTRPVRVVGAERL